MTMKNDFASEERRCELLFLSLGPCWHLYTPENHPVIFTDEADYKAAMTLTAICHLAFPQFRILTFELMSNHIHFTIVGPEKDLGPFFGMIRKYLEYYLQAKGRNTSLEDWEYKKRPIRTLDDARNVIAYDNRNGFIVNPAYSPYSYPWGANRCFFNTDHATRYAESKTVLRSDAIRKIFHTRTLDGFSGLVMLDGFVCPFAFCDITTAEGLFRNERHYFYSISKNVERMKEIAKEIGESIYYTDSDLFAIVRSYCKDRYGIDRPTLIPADKKIEVAKMMRFEYNASAKQITRMLKIDPNLLNSFLP